MRFIPQFVRALLPLLLLLESIATAQIISPNPGINPGPGPIIGSPIGGYPVIDFFQASPQVIDKIQPVRLFWRVRNAVRVDIFDSYRGTTVPDLGLENFIEVWPQRSANYVIYAYSAEGPVTTATLTVIFSPLRVDFFIASTYTPSPGEPVRLTWNVTGASRVDIFDSFTNTNYANLGLPNGSIEVYPTRSATYTMTVYNLNGETRIEQLVLSVRDGN